jgi:hypothetical protein
MSARPRKLPATGNARLAKREANPRGGSLEWTSSPPGAFRFVVPFELIDAMSARLDEQEARLGRPCALSLFGPDHEIPLDVWRTFWAQPRPLLQLVAGPLQSDWTLPILRDEAVLATAPVAPPIDGIAGFVVEAQKLPTPQFDAGAQEQMASALADLLLSEERQK